MGWPIIAAAGIAAASQMKSSSDAAGQSEDSRRQADRYIQASIQELAAIGIPTAEAMEISLERYREQGGELTPDMEQTIRQGQSEMGGISTDPRQQEAMNQALSELQDVGNQGGQRLSDKTVMQQGLGQVASSNRGRREAIEQGMREKGQWGGGQELAMQLQNAQASATQANQIGLGVGANAQERALQAIIESGKLGASQQQQSFGQQSDVAGAQDAVNRFNTQQQSGVVQRNVASMNQAREKNLDYKRRISEANTGLANEEERNRAGIGERRFGMEADIGKAQANIRAGQASQALDYGKAAAERTAKQGEAIGEIAMGAGQYFSDKPDDDEEKKRY